MAWLPFLALVGLVDAIRVADSKGSLRQERDLQHESLENLEDEQRLAKVTDGSSPTVESEDVAEGEDDAAEGGQDAADPDKITDEDVKFRKEFVEKMYPNGQTTMKTDHITDEDIDRMIEIFGKLVRAYDKVVSRSKSQNRHPPENVEDVRKRLVAVNEYLSKKYLTDLKPDKDLEQDIRKMKRLKNQLRTDDGLRALFRVIKFYRDYVWDRECLDTFRFRKEKGKFFQELDESERNKLEAQYDQQKNEKSAKAASSTLSSFLQLQPNAPDDETPSQLRDFGYVYEGKELRKKTYGEIEASWRTMAANIEERQQNSKDKRYNSGVVYLAQEADVKFARNFPSDDERRSWTLCEDAARSNMGHPDTAPTVGEEPPAMCIDMIKMGIIIGILICIAIFIIHNWRKSKRPVYTVADYLRQKRLEAFLDRL